MDCELQTADLSTEDFSMDFGWHPDIYSKLIGNSEYMMRAANAEVQQNSGGMDQKSNFASATSSLIQPEPFTLDYGSHGGTMNPTTLWPVSMDNPNLSGLQPYMQDPTHMYSQLPTWRSSSNSSPLKLTPRQNAAERRCTTNTLTSAASDVRSLSVQASPLASSSIDSASSISPGESEKTRRARYAANQRHSKAQKTCKDSQQHESTGEADIRMAESKQRLREKNKVAAAKCRSRQRKQFLNIQKKGSWLGKQNAELKTMIQELRGELNGLRSMALDHEQCDCHVARYNHSQAERIVAEYRAVCFGGHVTVISKPQGSKAH